MQTGTLNNENKKAKHPLASGRSAGCAKSEATHFLSVARRPLPARDSHLVIRPSGFRSCNDLHQNKLRCDHMLPRES